MDDIEASRIGGWAFHDDILSRYPAPTHDRDAARRYAAARTAVARARESGRGLSDLQSMTVASMLISALSHDLTDHDRKALGREMEKAEARADAWQLAARGWRARMRRDADGAVVSNEASPGADTRAEPRQDPVLAEVSRLRQGDRDEADARTLAYVTALNDRLAAKYGETPDRGTKALLWAMSETRRVGGPDLAQAARITLGWQRLIGETADAAERQGIEIALTAGSPERAAARRGSMAER